ncbi:formylglycine-generating enzyme family protein [Puia sp.]|uniref:formylglycine-generating enzyme family protein n=1 Tax=Puia sp. TaxID=2045100 RepID=UPI002F3F3E6E
MIPSILFTGSVYAQSFHGYEQAIPNSDVSFKMVPIPGSRTVDSFWMEEHETTYEEYILFQDESQDHGPAPDGVTRPSPPYVDFTLGMGKKGGFPANSMSRYAAMMYCKWLYKRTGVFYRLPTEGEWEYACRAGTGTAYPFGAGADSLRWYAWYSGNSDNRYHAVKQLKPNSWGLFDMLGNLAEWTLDAATPGTAYPLILKGGCFHDGAAALQPAARLLSDKKWNARDPQIPRSKWWNTDAPFIGFRVIKPVKQPTAAEAEEFYNHYL